MNQRDIELMKVIIDEVGNIGVGERVLFNVNYSRIVQINLVLLKILLDELGKKGIFITVDRPHNYMDHLLRMHRVVNRHRVMYLDTIANYSATGAPVEGNVTFADAPFQIDKLPDEILRGVAKSESKIDLKNNDFILIDNLAAMLNYNSQDMVVRFVERYLKAIALYNSIFTALIIDSRNHPELYEAIRPLCDLELEVTQDMDVKRPDMDGKEPIKMSSEKRKKVIKSILMFSPGGGLGAANNNPSGV